MVTHGRLHCKTEENSGYAVVVAAAAAVHAVYVMLELFSANIYAGNISIASHRVRRREYAGAFFSPFYACHLDRRIVACCGLLSKNVHRDVHT